MSTQAIRNIILRYREALGDDILPGQAEAIRGATEEVEAITTAAKTLERLGLAGLKCVSAENIRDHSDAEHLLFTIAKED